MHASNLPARYPSRNMVIAWEYEGSTFLRFFPVDFELLAEQYDGDIVTYVQEVHAPPLEWYFEL